MFQAFSVASIGVASCILYCVDCLHSVTIVTRGRCIDECRDAALAWETAFLQLAQTRLKDLAAEANLKLSFSSERSVEDELARETASDSATVAVSYLVMLLYIALALGTIPAGSSSWAVLVYSRVGVGLTGVMIVGLSVLAALGICSLFGMWATLIILEACFSALIADYSLEHTLVAVLLWAAASRSSHHDC